MGSFFSWISYVDLYIGEEREETVGYSKWKLINNHYYLEIRVKDIDIIDDELVIEELGTRLPIGKIKIRNKSGIFEHLFPVDKMGKLQFSCGKEKYYHELNSIRIIVNNEKSLRSKITLEYPARKEVEDIKKEEVKIEEVISVSPLKENKWDRLCEEYPIVYPFKEKRKFISIHPKDFNILSEDNKQVVGNSFLLHGYYQYGQMILGKLEEKDDAPYYIGIPGIFHEREKQSAGIFGFAGFEPVDSEINNGGYGYYMIEVRI